MSNSSNISNNARSIPSKTLKQAINNIYGSKNSILTKADTNYYGFDTFLEREDRPDRIKFKMTKTQYRKLLKNLDKVGSYFDLFEIFDITEDQRYEMFCHAEGNIPLKSTLMKFIKTKENVYSAIDSVINESMFYEYIVSCESFNSFFSTCAELIIKVNKNEDHFTELVNLFDKFEQRINDFPEDLKNQILDGMSDRYRLANEKELFVNDKREMIERIFHVADVTKQIPSLEIIKKYERFLSLRKILCLYRMNQADIEYSEGLSYYLKKQVERRLLDELGPAARVMEITMNWDMNALALFDEINEDDCCDEVKGY